MRDCDEFGKSGEGGDRRINLLFQALGAAEYDSRMHNTLGGFSFNVMPYKSIIDL